MDTTQNELNNFKIEIEKLIAPYPALFKNIKGIEKTNNITNIYKFKACEMNNINNLIADLIAKNNTITEEQIKSTLNEVIVTHFY